jgi:formamidopyrimidine-DNA glycosylase
MPELPDILILARSMNEALVGRTIVQASVHQPRVLNTTPQRFRHLIEGACVEHVYQRGKWLICDLRGDRVLAINLGMGGEVRVHAELEVPDSRREKVVFRLDDGRQVWIHFWWFGHVHAMKTEQLGQHPQISELGPEPLDDAFTVERLATMLKRKRGRVKSYLLDQRFIAGIGNVYVQDILWYARLNPNRPAYTLTDEEVSRLHRAIRFVLGEGVRYGGGPGEQDVWGNPGRYAEHLQVGYRTGKPCPACGTLIEEIRIGSTTSYICPNCQK